MFDTDAGVTRYDYPLVQWLPVTAMVIIAGLGIYVGIIIRDSGALIAASMILLGLIIAGVAVSAFFQMSPIEVDSETIAACRFGRRRRIINWRDVVTIKKIRLLNAGSYFTTFYVFDGHYGPLRARMLNTRGPIVFGGKLRGLDDLLSRINAQARMRHFSLFVIEEKRGQRGKALEELVDAL